MRTEQYCYGHRRMAHIELKWGYFDITVEPQIYNESIL